MEIGMDALDLVALFIGMVATVVAGIGGAGISSR
jgi:hypothetical protein